MRVLISNKVGITYTLRSTASSDKSLLIKAVLGAIHPIKVVKEFQNTDEDYFSDIHDLITFIKINSLINVLIINSWEELSLSRNDIKMFKDEFARMKVQVLTLNDLLLGERMEIREPLNVRTSVM